MTSVCFMKIIIDDYQKVDNADKLDSINDSR